LRRKGFGVYGLPKKSGKKCGNNVVNVIAFRPLFVAFFPTGELLLVCVARFQIPLSLFIVIGIPGTPFTLV
jgi:hypothetical protein